MNGKNDNNWPFKMLSSAEVFFLFFGGKVFCNAIKPSRGRQQESQGKAFLLSLDSPTSTFQCDTFSSDLRETHHGPSPLKTPVQCLPNEYL